MDNDADDGDAGHDADINDKLLLTTTASSMIDYSLLQTRIVQSIFLRCILSILCSCCFTSNIDSGVCVCDTDVNTNLTTFSFSFPKLFMYHYQLLQDIQYLDKIIFILKTRPFFLIVYRHPQCKLSYFNVYSVLKF